MGQGQSRWGEVIWGQTLDFVGTLIKKQFLDMI